MNYTFRWDTVSWAHYVLHSIKGFFRPNAVTLSIINSRLPGTRDPATVGNSLGMPDPTLRMRIIRAIQSKPHA